MVRNTPSLVAGLISFCPDAVSFRRIPLIAPIHPSRTQCMLIPKHGLQSRAPILSQRSPLHLRSVFLMLPSLVSILYTLSFITTRHHSSPPPKSTSFKVLCTTSPFAITRSHRWAGVILDEWRGGTCDILCVCDESQVRINASIVYGMIYPFLLML
jgi:hypothetical protein